MKMVKLLCDNPRCNNVFYRPTNKYYKSGKHYCSSTCVYEGKHLTYAYDPPSIFGPVGEVEEQLDILMIVVCRKLALMCDNNGNLYPGCDTETWEIYSQIHNVLCDIASVLLGLRGTTLGGSYDVRDREET